MTKRHVIWRHNNWLRYHPISSRDTMLWWFCVFGSASALISIHIAWRGETFILSLLMSNKPRRKVRIFPKTNFRAAVRPSSRRNYQKFRLQKSTFSYSINTVKKCDNIEKFWKEIALFLWQAVGSCFFHIDSARIVRTSDVTPKQTETNIYIINNSN